MIRLFALFISLVAAVTMVWGGRRSLLSVIIINAVYVTIKNNILSAFLVKRFTTL